MSSRGSFPAPNGYCTQENIIANLLVLSFLLALACVMAACGSASQGASSVASLENSSTAISLSPSTGTVASLGQLQFTASMRGTANTAVTWWSNAGTVSPGGLFTAPGVNANTPVTIIAASVGQPGSQAVANLTVVPPTSLTVTTTVIQEASADTAYTSVLSASGGEAPYQWSLARGSLPPGIQMQATGTITGTTTRVGSYLFTARVTDVSGHSATKSFNLAVSSNPAYDGPAELPRVFISTAMSNTPAFGSTSTVDSATALQSALNNANCGDTIQLQAGITFTGAFTFPANNCDDNHWIIVRTSADDSVLPAEGSRLTPCYAGVSSLPGRPPLQCTSTNNVLAKLVMPVSGNGPIVFAAGANHYRLIGLEVTRLAGTGIVYALAGIAGEGAVNNIILDRVWLHGTAQDDTNRGVDLGGSTYFSIIDSYFTDFHCVSITGACTDAQAVNGGLGSAVMGPYKIANDFLEASGENILFGGGSATAAPADIQITHNLFFKPLTWMQGQPGYVGGANGNPFVVKNLLELKNAQRVLVEGNIMENTWGGFSQVGFAILLTPKDQAGSNGSNVCPLCQVTDVTIRYDSISHVAAGLQIANALSGNGTGAPLAGERYSIHDIVIDDIDGVEYDGPGEFAQLSVSAGAPLLQNVTINHVTAFPPTFMFIIGDFVATSTQMKNIVFTNSIVNAGTWPVWSTGGGSTNCAYFDQPLTTFNACFSPYTFGSNAVIASPSGYPPSLWPSGNFFPANAGSVQFVDYNNGNGGNYQLLTTSPYHNAGTDGKDLGADISTLNSAIAGVE
jgi:Putative Ig domain